MLKHRNPFAMNKQTSKFRLNIQVKQTKVQALSQYIQLFLFRFNV